MVEMKHTNWLARGGCRSKIGLYDASMFDLGNNLSKKSKRKAYLEGKYIGKGPGIKEMRDKAESRSNVTPTPTNVSRVVEDTICGTNMHQAPKFYGDNQTVTKKR